MKLKDETLDNKKNNVVRYIMKRNDVRNTKGTKKNQAPIDRQKTVKKKQ